MAAQELYKEHWGIPNLLVLTVTTNEQHTAHMIQLINELTDANGSTMFVFMPTPRIAVRPTAAKSMSAEPYEWAGYEPINIAVC
jgi:hypothetical protein